MMEALRTTAGAFRDRVRRVHRHDLAGHQPVEQHPHRGEVLLRARLGVRLLVLSLNVGGDDGGTNLAEVMNSVPTAPRKKVGHGPTVGPAGVRVPDVGGEEFDDPPSSTIARGDDQGRQPVDAGAGQVAIWNSDGKVGQTVQYV